MTNDFENAKKKKEKTRGREHIEWHEMLNPPHTKR